MGLSDRHLPIPLPATKVFLAHEENQPTANDHGRATLPRQVAPQQVDLQTTAYHEAGHAAAVILSGGLYQLRGISLRERFTGPLPERFRHTGAHLTLEPQARVLDLLHAEQRPRAETLLVIVLAGVVAERFLLRQHQRERAFRHKLSCHGLYALLHFHGGDCLPEYRRWLQARAVHLVACHWRGLSRLAVVYITALDPWDYPDELLLVVCDWHHKERQAVEQAIYAEVGKHLATLDIAEMRRQPIYAFFQEDSMLDYFPAWQREWLRHGRDGIPSD